MASNPNLETQVKTASQFVKLGAPWISLNSFAKVFSGSCTEQCQLQIAHYKFKLIAKSWLSGLGGLSSAIFLLGAGSQFRTIFEVNAELIFIGLFWSSCVLFTILGLLLYRTDEFDELSVPLGLSEYAIELEKLKEVSENVSNYLKSVIKNRELFVFDYYVSLGLAESEKRKHIRILNQQAAIKLNKA